MAPRLERGSITAEFAVALPAVIIVVACSLSAVQVTGQQVRLQDAAAISARSLGRGESEDVAVDRARQLVHGANLSVERAGDLECATLRTRADGPAGLFALTLHARSCALGSGG